MITAAQIRAGRGLLGWSQQELATAAQLTPVALSRLERGETVPHAKTLIRLEKTMSQAGVEFLTAQGVRWRENVLETEMLEGADFMARWQSHVAPALAAMPGKPEALYVSTDERKFLQADPRAYRDQYEKLTAMGARERILIPEGHRFFICLPEVTTYRWLPAELSGQVPHGVVGEYVSFLFWQRPQRILKVRNQALAQTFRKHFEALWRASRPVPFTAKEIRQIVTENFEKYAK